MEKVVDMEGILFNREDEFLMPTLCDECMGETCQCRQLGIMDKLGLGKMRMVLKELNLDLNSEKTWDVLANLTMWD